MRGLGQGSGNVGQKTEFQLQGRNNSQRPNIVTTFNNTMLIVLERGFWSKWQTLS